MVTLAQIRAARAEWQRCEAVEAACDMAGDLAPFHAVMAAWYAYRQLVRTYLTEQDCSIVEYRARMERYCVAQGVAA